MVTVRVSHTIDDLANDLTAIATQTPARLSAVVRRNVEEGNRVAQGIARAASGPHGRLYYRRLTSEMTGTLTGEYGPEGDVAGNAVGAGWRNGPGNHDLEKSLDVQGPKFARDVVDEVDRMFW